MIKITVFQFPYLDPCLIIPSGLYYRQIITYRFTGRKDFESLIKDNQSLEIVEMAGIEPASKEFD